MAIVSPPLLVEERLKLYAAASWLGVSAVAAGLGFVTELLAVPPPCQPPTSAVIAATFGLMIGSVLGIESSLRDSSDSRRNQGRRAPLGVKTDGRRCPDRDMDLAPVVD